MTFVARFTDRHTNWGFVEDGKVYPAEEGTDLLDGLVDETLLSRLAQQRGGAASLDDVRLLAPIPDPPQFIGIGLNYRDHAAESGMTLPTEPVTFGFLRSSIIGEGDAIRLPHFTDQVDWEAELGIVIGKAGCDIAEADALDHVAGYTIVNDVSARDIQMSEGQWGRAKSFDTFKPMGPWIATKDSLGDASALKISLWVNGNLKQSSNTSELIFDVPELVSLLSRSTTLLPGAVISTGTPHGVGFSRTPPEFLQHGDEVCIEIEGIGRLTNPVRRSDDRTVDIL
jgi:2-keto-4-pentenoate hydratase/2-oxohepta-3-ene-1,7-dioic acid hydratase in catechol pathway